MNSILTGQQPPRVKRSKRQGEMMVDSDVEELSDDFFSAIHAMDHDGSSLEHSQIDTLEALEFVMGMSQSYDQHRRLSGASTTLCFEECLPPIRRRNSRDAVLPQVVDCDLVALQFKKKLQLAAEPVDAPASDILCGRYQLEARCMDPLDKHQPFDMSAFSFMLPINQNR